MAVTIIKNTAGKAGKQGKDNNGEQAAIIKASTPCDTCGERLTASGGFLALVTTFADAIGMQDVFES